MTVTEPHFPTARSKCLHVCGIAAFSLWHLMIQPELKDPLDADHFHFLLCTRPDVI